MSPRDHGLDQLTDLLGQCLGRIEAQAFRLQRDPDDSDETAVVAAFDDETELLQELIGSLLVCAVDEHADANATVERALRGCLGDLTVPLVVRQRLAPALPRVACSPDELAFAVQRALALAIGPLPPGGEIIVTTRREAEAVVFELESLGAQPDRHVRARSETLAEFVAGLHGHCRVESAADGTLLLALELPLALAHDER